VLDELGALGLVAGGPGRHVGPGGDTTGPNPVDCGRPGSKIQVVTDRAGLPFAVGVPTANVYDSRALQPMRLVPRPPEVCAMR
jgi:hypothetical protein